MGWGHSEKLSYSLENTVQLWENHDIYKEKSLWGSLLWPMWSWEKGTLLGCYHPSCGCGTAGGQRPLDYRKGGLQSPKLKPLLSLLHPRGIHPLGLLLPPSKPRIKLLFTSTSIPDLSHGLFQYLPNLPPCFSSYGILHCSEWFLFRETHIMLVCRLPLLPGKSPEQDQQGLSRSSHCLPALPLSPLHWLPFSSENILLLPQGPQGFDTSTPPSWGNLPQVHVAFSLISTSFLLAYHLR